MTPEVALERFAPGVWRLPLPSRTPPPWDHTNSWLIDAGDGALWWVDAGFAPGDTDAQRRIDGALAALDAERLAGVLLTHGHADHVRGVPALRARFPDTPVRIGAAEAERVPIDGGSEPPADLADGDVLAAPHGAWRAVATPGHAPGHRALWRDADGASLVGDLLTAEGSVFVGAPDGDLVAYLASLERIAALEPSALGPGHGPAVTGRPAVAGRLAAVTEHRLERERQVVAALAAGGERSVAELRAAVYPQLEGALADLAERTLDTHLEALRRAGRAERRRAPESPPGDAPRWRLR